MLTAGGTGDLMLVDVRFHLCLGEGIHGLFQRNTVFGAVVLNELVCTEAFVAFAAIHQRIGKPAQMSGCDPGLRIHQDRGV